MIDIDESREDQVKKLIKEQLERDPDYDGTTLVLGECYEKNEKKIS